MTAVYIPFYRQQTLPNINEERSVQGQINQIITYVFVIIFIRTWPRFLEKDNPIIGGLSCFYLFREIGTWCLIVLCSFITHMFFSMPGPT